MLKRSGMARGEWTDGIRFVPDETPHSRYHREASAMTQKVFPPGWNEERIYVGDAYERLTTETGEVQHLYKVFAAGRQIAQLERTEGTSGGETRYIHGDHQGHA